MTQERKVEQVSTWWSQDPTCGLEAAMQRHYCLYLYLFLNHHHPNHKTTSSPLRFRFRFYSDWQYMWPGLSPIVCCMCDTCTMPRPDRHGPQCMCKNSVCLKGTRTQRYIRHHWSSPLHVWQICILPALTAASHSWTCVGTSARKN